MRLCYYLRVVCLWKILYELDVFVSSLNSFCDSINITTVKDYGNRKRARRKGKRARSNAKRARSNKKLDSHHYQERTCIFPSFNYRTPYSRPLLSFGRSKLRPTILMITMMIVMTMTRMRLIKSKLIHSSLTVSLVPLYL